MPNDVFRANDAVLVLAVDDTSTPEGKAADALVSQYDLSNVVGRLRDVTVTVTTTLKTFYEIGRRYPTQQYVSPEPEGEMEIRSSREIGAGKRNFLEIEEQPFHEHNSRQRLNQTETPGGSPSPEKRKQ